jgi:hypothetical protein
MIQTYMPRHAPQLAARWPCKPPLYGWQQLGLLRQCSPLAATAHQQKTYSQPANANAPLTARGHPMTDHPYDTPGLTPHEFLLATMHDQAAPLPTRMEAAEHLLRLGFNHSHVKTIRVVISGGLPAQDWSDTCRDINDCRTRTTPCPWQRHLGHLCHELLQVEGHA